MNIFAHAGEIHESTQETTSHLLLSPYMALPIFVLLMIGFYYGLKKLGLKTPTVFNLTLALLLVIGILGYTLVPIVSIFSIAFGITMALFLVLTGIGQ